MAINQRYDDFQQTTTEEMIGFAGEHWKWIRGYGDTAVARKENGEGRTRGVVTTGNSICRFAVDGIFGALRFISIG